MVNQFQASLLTARRGGKAGLLVRLAFIQAAFGFALILLASAFGLFTASHVIGQEGMLRKAATANVLPPLVISDEALQPNLAGMLATGDGGAMIEPSETTDSLRPAASSHPRWQGAGYLAGRKPGLFSRDAADPRRLTCRADCRERRRP
jgi:hypothetical protein